MADGQAKQASGSRGLLYLLIIGLFGVVCWLTSERNQRHYTLSSRDGVVVVSRGMFLPVGSRAIGPGDPDGKIYSGIALPPGTKNLPETEYDDEAALDRGLYDLLGGAAHALAKKSDAQSVQQADALAKRLSALRGLSAEELADLASLRAELAWWSAGADVKDAALSLLSARRKLEEVRANGGEHATLAQPLEDDLKPLAEQLAALGNRFAPGANVGMANVGTTNIAVEVNNSEVNNPDGGAGTLADGGLSLAPIPAVPPPSVASPPGAPAENSIVPPAPSPAPERHGASAPGSVSSGAVRGE